MRQTATYIQQQIANLKAATQEMNILTGNHACSQDDEDCVSSVPLRCQYFDLMDSPLPEVQGSALCEPGFGSGYGSGDGSDYPCTSSPPTDSGLTTTDASSTEPTSVSETDVSTDTVTTETTTPVRVVEGSGTEQPTGPGGDLTRTDYTVVAIENRGGSNGATSISFSFLIVALLSICSVMFQ